VIAKVINDDRDAWRIGQRRAGYETEEGRYQAVTEHVTVRCCA